MQIPIRRFASWIIRPLFFGLFASVLLIAAVKGKPGSPLAFQSDHDTSTAGPFESSNSSSRYALAETLVLHHKFSFDVTEARFAAPDLVYHNGVFQSIFTPGIAILAAPLLWVGLQFGAPQLGAFSLNLFLALINSLVVYKLARKVGASVTSSWLGSFVFLFATNAYAYAMTLTQHHGSILVLLLALYVALNKPSWRKNIAFGILTGIGILFDFPNVFLLFPIGLLLLSETFSVTEEKNHLQLKVRLAILGILFGLMPFVAFFGYYNQTLTGSPLKIGQFLGRTNYFDSEEKKQQDLITYQAKPYQPKLPFQTRIQLEGMKVLATGNERSWLFYSPVLWIGLLGILALIKKPQAQKAGLLFLSIIATNFVVYSMFGDPWGGWSFGARYLLPAAALMSVMVAVALTHYRSSLLTLLFTGLTIYSVLISTAGAITSAAIPPEQEARALNIPSAYTYTFNFKMLNQDQSGSLVYNLYATRWFTGIGYFAIVCGVSFFLFGTLLIYYLAARKARS